jgi:site-specific DNA-methyltransferase (adenine-specific)
MFTRMPDPKYPLDKMNKADGLDLLRGTPENYSKLVVFDPQYRGLPDKLKYGNEGKRQKGRFVLPQMSDSVITKFGLEIVRILGPSGYCALWADKMMLCQAIAPQFFGSKLEIVDLITWDKRTFGMGYRSRRRGEHLIILQKPPIKARATWRSMPSIPDVWQEKITNKIHAHQKPFELQRAIIEATTNPGDVVIDPVAGSFSLMACAHACGRRFLGGDIMGAPHLLDALQKIAAPSIEPQVPELVSDDVQPTRTTLTPPRRRDQVVPGS